MECELEFVSIILLEAVDTNPHNSTPRQSSYPMSISLSHKVNYLVGFYYEMHIVFYLKLAKLIK